MSKVKSTDKRGWFKTAAYFLTAVVWIGAVIYTSFFVPPLEDPNTNVFRNPLHVPFRFGFSQLQKITPVVLAASSAALALLLVKTDLTENVLQRVNDWYRRVGSRKWPLRLAATIAFMALFWALRSNFENTDFGLYLQWYPDDAARGLTHVRFDEMWESYGHFFLFKLLNTTFNIPLQQVFQLTSVVMGGAFIYAALSFSSSLDSEQPLNFLLVVLSGGFMQLFFGDMECYTIAGMLTFLYLYYGYRFLEGKCSLAVPAFVLMLAMTAHLETIFLVPSLVFLGIVQVQRRVYQPILTALLVFSGFFSWTLIFFLSQGVSLQRLIDTSWGMGRGGSILANITEFHRAHLWGQINLLGLIFPPIWFLPPLALSGGVKRSPLNLFLGIAAVCGVAFFFLWQSTIGLYMDWNLFSVPIIPAVVLFAANFPRQDFPLKKRISVVAFLFAYLMSYAWILSNHFGY